MFYLFRWKIKMNLYKKLQKYTIKDAIYFEEIDRQFLALKKLYENKVLDDKNYLFLIIANSLICYQLSWKWEDYWEEFSEILENKNFNNFLEIYSFFEKFIPESKSNRRFIDTKLKRISKLEIFYSNFLEKYEFYYKNMDELVSDLSKTMNQKKEAKTIVFAVKMFWYWARNIFWLKYFSQKLMIPIDSRLENLYKKYENIDNDIKINNLQIKNFYIELSRNLKIPLLHLDAILWVNYEELIK